IAVTGTNGKTSIVHYLRQIWEFLGYKSATIGTVGDNQHSFSLGGLTTPPPTDLHLGIERIAKSGFTHLGVEASSHGISQYRLDAMMLKGAAFSNLSQDHLDYHQSLSQYWEAKRGLFSRVLQPGGFIVFPLGCQQSNDLTKLSKQRQLRCFAWDMNDANSRYDHAVINATLNQDGIGARLRLGGVEKQVVLKLYGAFQLENLMTAMLCAYALESSHLNQHALNEKATRILSCLDQIKPVVGRMQLAAKCINGALVVVDYAHTPDALKNALIALKKHFDQTGIKNNIAVMFGCGGNRDRLKRAQMGKIANEFADFVIVSDDNPRDEDPSAIRKEIMKECPKGIEVAGRREGIYQALKLLKDHDVLLIAGKGHEKIQIIGKNEIVFDDLETAKEMVALLDLKQ
ncbi:MAG: UDP-N-acetylmuramoyl-L-alanyl-D-glutamate--2,6-diaminopimelate ligase, partial [Pseudomonadota bacterium]